ncbi:unnamed protein product [Peronospora effusa]|nr:unnamed protein product [Peronospora effusa]
MVTHKIVKYSSPVSSTCRPIYAMSKVHFRTDVTKICLIWLFFHLLTLHFVTCLFHGSHGMSDLDFHGLRAHSAKFQYFVDDTNEFITMAKMQFFVGRNDNHVKSASVLCLAVK